MARSRARISPPSTARKFSLRLRSETALQLLPPAASSTPEVSPWLVNILIPPQPRATNWLLAVGYTESDEKPAQPSPSTTEPWRLAVRAFLPMATEKLPLALFCSPMATPKLPLAMLGPITTGASPPAMELGP